MECPNKELCKCLGWHCHGKVYELYLNREDYRRKIDQECADKSSPSLLTKIINYGKAAVKHLADGLAKADDESYLERLIICSECEKLNSKAECSVCGCPVDAKASWRSEECPLHKWQRLPLVIKDGGCSCR